LFFCHQSAVGGEVTGNDERKDGDERVPQVALCPPHMPADETLFFLPPSPDKLHHLLLDNTKLTLCELSVAETRLPSP
jgi:hypothetical protein